MGDYHDVEASPGDVQGIADGDGDDPGDQSRNELFKFLIREHLY